MYRLISIQTHTHMPVTDEYRKSKIGHLFELHLPTEGGAICLSNEVNEVSSFITTKICSIHYLYSADGKQFIKVFTTNSIYKFRKEEI